MAVTMILEEITELTQAEARIKRLNADLEQRIKVSTDELADSKNKYLSLVKTSSDGIFIFDPNSKRINEANSQFLNMLDYREQEVTELTLDDLLLVDTVPGNNDFHRIITDGKTIGIRNFRRKNGSVIPTEVTGTVIYYGQSELCLVNIRDISDRKQAEEALQQSFLSLKNTLQETVNALMIMAEQRDPYTAGHQMRVAKLACAIAREMGMGSSETVIEGIFTAGVLHDIGKIYVPAEILNKPGKLSEIEMSIIKTHPEVGHKIIEGIPFDSPVAQMILEHHERLDGSGYPYGLTGKNILLEAKILGVADVVEAMASHRPYRPSVGLEIALEEIKKKKGICYDPDVVDACLKLLDSNKRDLDQIIRDIA